jgi:hypothetical protein
MEDFLNQGPWVMLLFLVFIIWSFIWKGLALWQSARNGHKVWFVALLLINTLGILEILYIYVFGKAPQKTI